MGNVIPYVIYIYINILINFFETRFPKGGVT